MRIKQSKNHFSPFESGDARRDITALLNMAIDLVETWKVDDSPYNQMLKEAWMKRAQELGAIKCW